MTKLNRLKIPELNTIQINIKTNNVILICFSSRKLISLSQTSQNNSTTNTRCPVVNTTDTTEEMTVQSSPSRCTNRSSNVSAEEISVTPDISSVIGADHPINNVVYVMPPTVRNSPAIVTAETGFHFLSQFGASEPPTVDLTCSDDTETKLDNILDFKLFK